MATLSLKDFIRTGELGPIHLGVNKQQVIDYLGQPNMVTDFKNGRSELRYASWRLFYFNETEKIYAIIYEHTEQPIHYKKLVQLLQQDQINFVEKSVKFFDIIICPSGVELLFSRMTEYPNDKKYDRDSLELYDVRHFQNENTQM